ncbi:MAG: TonB-dependent receptor [Leeuwenhoekiella sp.]
MKAILFAVLVVCSTFAFAQETGTLEGTLTDKEAGNQPLPFANVLIKGTTKGATTDFDGKYIIKNIPVGTYAVEFSFVGYETVTIPNVVIQNDKFTNVSTALGASAATLNEVVIQVQTSRELEEALLLEQKQAVEIKESIGAVQLARQGVTDAATATTKISGVTSSEASGDIYVRGLGDRYLYTTLNNLPIPSDDVERKNIDLSLFSTRVIQSVDISKTYSVSNSADQASGTINIASKELSGTKELSVGVRTGVNTNAVQSGVSDNFLITANTSDYSFGFLKDQGFNQNPLPSGGASRDVANYPRITQQSWNPNATSSPINYRYAVTGGKKIGENFKFLVTGSQSSNYDYRQGVFREFSENFIDDSITDATEYRRNIATTGLLNLDYRVADGNNLRGVVLYVNNLSDIVFEGGRNGEASIFEETDINEPLSQFVRDQNTRQTQLLVNQLLGDHKIGERHDLSWGLAYNIVNANEPNRIRNEFNVNEDLSFVQFGRTGGFQQRKTFQLIDDEEVAANLQDVFVLSENIDTGNAIIVTGGANFRYKTRDFLSQFIGVEEDALNTINPSSLDNLDPVFTTDNFASGDLDINLLPTDTYDASLTSKSAFAAFNLNREKFNFNVGLRYQQDDLTVTYNVNNARPGEVDKSYNNIYWSTSAKYDFTDDQALRFAASRTITLPEFKEIAPFEYVSPVGQVTRGNPDLEASNNYNFDLKYEWFPTTDQLLSLAGFYKFINDPINRVLERSASGIFSYFNAGDQATIFGLELEGRVNLIKIEDGNSLNLSGNLTRMFHKQDLKDVPDGQGGFTTFRYNGKTEEGLQGASDWIANATLSFETAGENPFQANAIVNYASDKIFSLGSPQDQNRPDVLFDEAIVEKGFVVLDAVFSKTFYDNLEVKFTARNLLNPKIERSQITQAGENAPEINNITRSYDTGRVFLIGVSYEIF